jgi:hypothetical protein
MFRFSTHRRFLALGALVLGLGVIAPSASAMIPDPGHGTAQAGAAYDGLRPGDAGYYTRDVGATASDAGLPSATTYGVLHQFPNAGLGIVRPDDRATHGPGAVLEPGDLGYYTHDVGATASDAGLVGDGLVSRPAPADSLAGTQDAPASPVATAPSSGFDWRDAGAGIAIGLLVAMFLGGLLVLSRRRGTPASA